MFGISTHLYIGDRLERDHLVEIAAHGFDAVEVFAVRSHFDYRDRRAAIALAEWLDDTRLKLHSLHAPIARDYTGGTWHDNLSLAATDDARRKAAVDETLAALDVAAAVAYSTLVVHGGIPEPYGGAADNPALRRAPRG
jgi:sugar phosphate isomerase/epimerase